MAESEREELLRHKGVTHLAELSLDTEVNTTRHIMDKVSIPDHDLSEYHS